MASRPLTREAVEAAIAECDAIGREAFRKRYGFKKSRDYVLLANGEEYDSKAIVAVAHKFLPEPARPLAYNELSGGLSDAAQRLIEAGFEVAKPNANPHDVAWSWEEHVLALELYLADPTVGKGSQPIQDLSQLLRKMAARLGISGSDKFRNANGVYMKLMNFRRLDPAYQSLGKAGLSQGAKGEELVWERYADDLPALKEAARLIRLAIEAEDVPLDQPEDEPEASEGTLILRLHKARERDRDLPNKKRQSVLSAKGKLQCEVCDFDFSDRYGDLGHGYIEVHHCKPLASMVPGERTKLSDLAVVCANCHRMLHRRSLTLSLDDLRAAIRA